MSNNNSYLWQVYCDTESQYVSTISDTEPTTCPNNISHTIDSSKTAVTKVKFIDLTTDSYINIRSTLADSQAIRINAANTNGGIDIDGGLGGISVDTTNSISLDAGAASNFTTSLGNLVLESTTGLTNINAGSGINIGTTSLTPVINVGTSADAKTVSIGNLTGATTLNMVAGTGGVDTQSTGKINYNTSNASTDAFRVFSSGGVDVDCAGIVAVDTSDAISLDAVAASNFSTSSGNLTFESTAGTTIINGGTAISVGATSITPIINIGTSADAKTLNIGNLTSTTIVNLLSGTGGLNTQSTGKFVYNTSNTASDAFKVSSSGGMDFDCSGGITFDTASGGSISLDAVGASSNFSVATNGSAQDLVLSVTGATDSSIFLYSEGTAIDAISLSAASGGIVLSSASSQGLILTSNGGIIGIGTWTGGEIQIGTAAVARTITIGNTTDNTVVAINAGGTSGGINIGNNANNGSIGIGNSSTGKTIIVGNSNDAGVLYNRFGTGGFIKHQSAHVALANADATLTAAELLTGILSGTPTVNRTLTLPTASNLVSAIGNAEAGDSIEFLIINKSSSTDEASFIIAAGSGGSTEGNMTVSPFTNNVQSYNTSGSGVFIIRITNTSTPAYVAYRSG
jgi:hypothetical protein